MRKNFLFLKSLEKNSNSFASKKTMHFVLKMLEMGVYKYMKTIYVR